MFLDAWYMKVSWEFANSEELGACILMSTGYT